MKYDFTTMPDRTGRDAFDEKYQKWMNLSPWPTPYKSYKKGVHNEEAILRGYNDDEDIFAYEIC